MSKNELSYDPSTALKDISKFMDDLLYQEARIEDLIMSFAEENKLNDFYRKWNKKPYSDEDHDNYHMLSELLVYLKAK